MYAKVKQAFSKEYLKGGACVIVGFYAPRFIHRVAVSKIKALAPYREITDIIVLLIEQAVLKGDIRVYTSVGSMVSLFDDLAKRLGYELV